MKNPRRSMGSILNFKNNMLVIVSVLFIMTGGIQSTETASAMTAKQTTLSKPVMQGKPVKLEINLTPDINVTLLLVTLSVFNEGYGNSTFLINTTIDIKEGENWVGNVSYVPPFAGKFFYSFEIQCNDSSENIITNNATMIVREETQPEVFPTICTLIIMLILIWIATLTYVIYDFRRGYLKSKTTKNQGGIN